MRTDRANIIDGKVDRPAADEVSFAGGTRPINPREPCHLRSAHVDAKVGEGSRREAPADIIKRRVGEGGRMHDPRRAGVRGVGSPGHHALPTELLKGWCQQSRSRRRRSRVTRPGGACLGRLQVSLIVHRIRQRPRGLNQTKSKGSELEAIRGRDKGEGGFCGKGLRHRGHRDRVLVYLCDDCSRTTSNSSKQRPPCVVS